VVHASKPTPCAAKVLASKDKVLKVEEFPIQSITLTIYKDGALLKQSRHFPLRQGEECFRIPDFTHSILAESLMISLSAMPNEARVEEFSLTNTDNEQSKALDLTVHSQVDEPKGYLNIAYLFKDMSWQPSYAIQFSTGYEHLMFNGWIEVMNHAGIDFKNAQIQFVDGSVPNVQSSPLDTDLSKAKGYVYAPALDLLKGVSKRINWVSSQTLTAKKDFRVFVGGNYLNDMDNKVANPVVETWVSFNNTTENGMGQPLPPGVAILYYQDEHGHLDLLGRAPLQYVEPGQEISFKVPVAQIEKSNKSDNPVKAIETELEQNQYRHLSDNRITEANYHLSLRNSSSEPITIRVTLDLPNDADWTIVRETVEHKTNGQKEAFWTLDVPAKKGEVKGEADLKYQIRLIREVAKG
jgi:hypothetical protein